MEDWASKIFGKTVGAVHQCRELRNRMLLNSDRRGGANRSNRSRIVGLEVLLEAHDRRITPGASQRENQGRTTFNIQQKIAGSREGRLDSRAAFPETQTTEHRTTGEPR
jgi:hypothetical protein